MQRRQFIQRAGMSAAAVAATGTLAGCTNAVELQPGEVLHTVLFDLKHPVESAEAQQFLSDGKKILTSIPGVCDFQAYRQCSPKNDYQYGFLMRFRNQAEFDAYTAHPDHTRFVNERWEVEVGRFQESDFKSL